MPDEELSATQKVLESMLADPLLNDLPKNPTLEDVDALLALEQGDGFRVTVERELILTQSSTLRDLKRLVRTTFIRAASTSASPGTETARSISWRSVWKRHKLALILDRNSGVGNGIRLKKLENDEERVFEAGVRPGSRLKFVKVLRNRKGRRAQR
ncbi:hypothetical protein HK104_009260 [Borealophlyctis nickersoniae]|nr:hypothetical protein HK104_009260 [Borealophlyctis nickersoniae]